MTCVLSMSPLYQSKYNGSITDVQNDGLKFLDFNLINSKVSKHSDFKEESMCCFQSQLDTSNDSPQRYQFKIANGIPGNIKNVLQLNTEASDWPSPLNGNAYGYEKSSMCIPSEISKNGLKRKALVTDYRDVYIPSKRVSPFLNTPKERKDERRKIIKISMNKIKDLDNPETFLRRSVLINNLTKTLQTELREEKHVSRTFSSYRGKCFYDKEVLNNNCLSDIYLCDDPFLSGTHEAITDDMTDTLINNVLNDNQSNETKGGYYQ